MIAPVRSRLAEALDAERRATELAMTPGQRMRLALRLGDEAARLYRDLHPGTTLAEAREALAAERRRGRNPSRCADRT